MKPRTAFVYCGTLGFRDMQGDYPVTVEFEAAQYVTEDAPPSLAAIYDWAPKKSADKAERARTVELAVRRETGQGHESNPALRRALELYGMERAKAYYQQQTFEVKDTSSNRPYDLECRRGPEIRRVEVKATQSGGHKVLVTIGEVKAASDPSVTTDLFVLHSIKASIVDSSPLLSGGVIRLIENWCPDEKDLEATVLNYRVPRGDVLA